MKKFILTCAVFYCMLCVPYATLAQEKGNLIYIETEHVSPENLANYMTWAKEYKELAAESNGHNFFVSSSIEGVSYIHSVGARIKRYSGLKYEKS